jgi:hypothetical protein
MRDVLRMVSFCLKEDMSMRKVLVLLAGLALIASVHATTGISGIVTNADNSHPIMYARVCCRAESSRAYTDTTGFYLFSQLAPGTYTVTVGASGFLKDTYPEPVVVVDGQVTPDINFALVVAPPPESTGISGRVTNYSTGAPISHASVALSGQSTVYTDADGAYYCAASAGWHNAWASADGYLNGIYPESLLVEQGATRESINFALISTFGQTGIGGRLTDASRMLGIPGGTVVASGPNGSGSATSVSTGGYLISDLPAGRYQVMAEAQGYQTAYGDSVTVVAGQVCWAPFYMHPLAPPPDFGSIAGQVADSSTGEIIVHAIVRASCPHFYRQIAQTSEGYRIDSLPPGKYWVSAMADGYQGGAFRESVLVSAGEVREPVSFNLEPYGGGQTGGISGLVTNSQTSEPIFGALVLATGPSQGYVNSDQNGEYVLHNLLPGSYLVMAVARGFHPSAWDTVSVIAGEVTYHVDFALEPMESQGDGGISGVVRDSATQAGIPLARVFAWSPGGQGLTYADSSGNYEIDHLPAGNYVLRASADGYYPSYHMDSVAVVAGQVTSGVDFALRHVLLLDAGIGGFVIDGYSQNEVAGAHVVATSSNGSFDAYCDSHGDYLLTRLAPGEYIVQVDASGYEPEVYPEPVTVTLGSVTCFVSPAMHTPTGTKEKPITLPEAGKLSVAPNPFAVQALVRWQLPKLGEARVQMYDNSGRLVRTLLNMTLQPGSYSAIWDGKDNLGRELPCGAYFCRLLTAGGSTSRMIVLLR